MRKTLIVILLVVAPAVVGQPASDVLHEAALRGDVDAVARLLEEGHHPESYGYREAPTAVIALDRGHLDVVQLLIEKSDAGVLTRGLLQALLEREEPDLADLWWSRLQQMSTVEGEEGLPATMMAGDAADGNVAAVEFLLARGVPIDEGFESPLIGAIRGGQTETVRYLLKQGADVNREGIAGGTAVMLAIFEGRTELLEVVLEAEPDLNVVGKEGDTPLGLAARFGGPEIVERLLRVPGIEIDIRDHLGRTPLMHAAELGCDACALLLLEAGADPSIVDAEGQTAEEIATARGFRSMAALLRGEKKVVQKILNRSEPAPVSEREEEWVSRFLRTWLADRSFEKVESFFADHFESQTAGAIGVADGKSANRRLLELPFDPEGGCVTFCGDLTECLTAQDADGPFLVETILADSDLTLGFPSADPHVGEHLLGVTARFKECPLTLIILMTREETPEVLAIEYGLE